MTYRSSVRLVALIVFSSSLISQTPAQVVKQDSFNTDTSSDYRVFQFNSDRDGVEFGFDYGAIGIPEAPNSTDGGTTGVRFYANNPADGIDAATSAVQMIPSKTGSQLVDIDYRVTYDIWMNVNGPLPGGGGGSTEAFLAGVGWNGANAIETGTENGTYFSITGDGGSSTDVRAFTSAGFNAEGVLVAPGNSTDPHYADIFPGGVDVGLLPVQGGQDNQSGTTAAGQMAFQWHEIRLDVIGNSIEFFVDDLLIASATDSDRTGNVMIGYADYFDSVTDAPQWSFGLVDNLKIETVPEPTSLSIFALSASIVLLRFRRK